MNYNKLWTFLTLFLIVLIIDVPVISFVFRKLWETSIKTIQGTDMIIKPGYAFITYLLIPLGILLFVYPLIDKTNWIQTSLLYGFLFGIIVYGVFDFTNLTILDKYPLNVAVIDTLWGGVLCALVSLLSYIFVRDVLKISGDNE